MARNSEVLSYYAMKSFIPKALGIGGMISCFIPLLAGANTIYDSGSFEPPRFVAGPLAGQDQWEVVSGKPERVSIGTTASHDGRQALMIASTGARNSARRQFIASEEFWIDLWIQPPPANLIARNFSLILRRGKSSKSLLAIQFQAGHTIQASGTRLNTRLYRYEEGQWHRLTLHVSLKEGHYELSLNGKDDESGARIPLDEKVVSGDPVDFELGWTSSQEADAHAFVDSLVILETNPLSR